MNSHVICVSIWLKHILFHFAWKGVGQSTDATLKSSPAQHLHLYVHRYSIIEHIHTAHSNKCHQYNTIYSETKWTQCKDHICQVVHICLYLSNVSIIEPYHINLHRITYFHQLWQGKWKSKVSSIPLWPYIPDQVWQNNHSAFLFYSSEKKRFKAKFDRRTMHLLAQPGFDPATPWSC